MNEAQSAAEVAFTFELAQLRRHAGLTRHALAEQVGIDPEDVDRSEAGVRSVDVIELFYWCVACGTTLGEFVQGLDQHISLGSSSRWQ